MNWGTVWLPHDGFHKKHQTGIDDRQVMEGLGWVVDPNGAPNVEVATGIDRARELFPRIYFNKDRTERLVECLKRYRWNINSKTGHYMMNSATALMLSVIWPWLLICCLITTLDLRRFNIKEAI
jgi:hypothetical protein